MLCLLTAKNVQAPVVAMKRPTKTVTKPDVTKPDVKLKTNAFRQKSSKKTKKTITKSVFNLKLPIQNIIKPSHKQSVSLTNPSTKKPTKNSPKRILKISVPRINEETNDPVKGIFTKFTKGKYDAIYKSII